MTPTLDLSRRGFIIGTGATGLTIGILSSARPANAQAGADAIDEINAWVHIGADDTVTIRIARSEMGQGTLTGLAQLVAEELECDLGQSRHRVSDARGKTWRANASWGDFSTGGSRGIPRFPPVCAGRGCGSAHDVD